MSSVTGDTSTAVNSSRVPRDKFTVEVALFIPCYIDQFYPRVGMATAQVLERHGARVVFPEEQTCCGQPMSNAGSLDEARKLAEKFLRIFATHRYVVSPSGSCTSMVRNHYGPLLGDRATELTGKVFELCEFLHDVLHAQPRGRYEARVGLHQSCHGLRELRLGTGSERILAPRAKVRDRLAFAFALTSCAAGLEIAGGSIKTARIALGGVGTKPWRSVEAERALAGELPKREAFRKAAEIALQGAKPRKDNAFKVELAKRTIVRALSLAAAEGA